MKTYNARFHRHTGEYVLGTFCASLRLGARAEGRRTARLLRLLHKRDGGVEVTTELPGKGKRITHKVRCVELHEEAGNSTAILEIAGVGAPTEMRIDVRGAGPGSGCRLRLRADPTAMLLGTDAFAVKLDLGYADGSSHLFSFPFALLRGALRAVEPRFDWTPAAAKRLRTGRVWLRDVSIGLYVPFYARWELTQLLRSVDASYRSRSAGSVPRSLKDGGWTARQVETYLGLRVAANGRHTLFDRDGAGPVQPVASFRFHDRLSALEDGELASLGKGTRASAEKFLETNVRLDVVMHRGLLRELSVEAGTPKADTVRGWCRSEGVLRRSSFRDANKFSLAVWLYHWVVYGEVDLRWSIYRCAETLDAVKRGLAHLPDVLAALGDWRGPAAPERGRRAAAPQLEDVLRARGLPEDTVRRGLAAVREAGLDPDVPPPSARQLATLAGVGKAGTEKLLAAAAAGGLAETIAELHDLDEGYPCPWTYIRELSLERWVPAFSPPNSARPDREEADEPAKNKRPKQPKKAERKEADEPAKGGRRGKKTHRVKR